MQISYVQFCYVVHDIDATVAKWIKDFGAGPFYKMDDRALRQRMYRGQPARDEFVAAIGFLGSTILEFVQPLNAEPSIFREILDTRGEVVHHIAPHVRTHTPQEYAAVCARYTAAGFKPAAELIVPGFGRNVFFDAVAKYGYFIEVLEVPPEAAHITPQMHAEHLAWNGRDPIRAMELPA